MPDVDLSELLATPSYKPSGKCSGRIVPLIGLGVVLALGLAFILHTCEGDYYIPVATAGALGLPLYIATWLILSFGRCRNVKLAVAISVFLTLVFYLGYWEISYYMNVIRPGATRYVELSSGGARGIWSYFLFRTQHSHPQESIAALMSGTGGSHASGDKLLNGLLFAAEMLFLIYVAVLIGLANSRRVFYEHLNRWAESFGFQLEPGDTQTVLKIAQTQMWGELADLRHIETDFTARIKVAALLFKVELLSDVPEEPIYISLRANRLGPAGKRVVEAFGGKGDFFFKQVPLSVDSSRRFRHYFAKELESAFFMQPAKKQ